MKRSDDSTKRGSKGTERREPPSVDRVFLLCLVADTILIGGLLGVGCWAHRQLSLEKSFRQQYGPDWQDEFERYHGPIAHAHSQIEVCALGLLALTAIVTWLCIRTFRRRAMQRFTYHSV